MDKPSATDASLRTQILLTDDNAVEVRKLSEIDDRSINNVANRLISEALLKRAVKSLPTKVKR